MATLHIKNIKAFGTFLTTVIKFVPCAQFKVYPTKTTMQSKDETGYVRGFFETDSMTLIDGDSAEFCFSELNKILKSLLLISSLDESLVSIDLKLTKSFIEYDGQSQFKFKLVKPDLFEKYMTPDIKTELKTNWSFKTTNAKMAKILQANSIVNIENANLYIFVKGNTVMVEINDKTSNLSDIIGIPVSESYEGTLMNALPVKLEYFKNVVMLRSSEIQVNLIQTSSLEVTLDLNEADFYIKCKLYIPIQKL